MKTPEQIFEILNKEFADAVIAINSELPSESIISVDPLKIKTVCLYLRDEKDLEFDTLMVLSGVDDANGEKQVDEAGDEIIIGGTLSVYYHLYSVKLNHKITLMVSTPRDNPEVESVENIWKCANWHEREAYDMYGFQFLNHPDLIRILMPYDWEAGYPLRKDYKNPEFYKGMKVPY